MSSIKSGNFLDREATLLANVSLIFFSTSNSHFTLCALYLLLPQAALLAGSDAGSDVVKQASTLKTVKPRVLCGVRCMGHVITTWSAVCSETPHSQFGEGARPHLCMDEWNRPNTSPQEVELNPSCSRQAHPKGLALVLDIKTRSLEIFSQYSAFHLWFVYSVCKHRMPSPAKLFKRFRAAGTNEPLDLNLVYPISNC